MEFERFLKRGIFALSEGSIYERLRRHPAKVGHVALAFLVVALLGISIAPYTPFWMGVV